MPKAEPEMFDRLAEELDKLRENGWTNVDIADELRCRDVTVWRWKHGWDFPSITHLRDLYEIGCDIMYIITGEVTRA
jgi:hypothetical protein